MGSSVAATLGFRLLGFQQVCALVRSGCEWAKSKYDIFGGAGQEKNRGAGDPCCGLYWGSSARRSCHSIKSGRSKSYRGATDMARRGLSN